MPCCVETHSAPKRAGALCKVRLSLITKGIAEQDCMMFSITHSPECITKRKDPMTDFRGSDRLVEKHDALLRRNTFRSQTRGPCTMQSNKAMFDYKGKLGWPGSLRNHHHGWVGICACTGPI